MAVIDNQTAKSAKERRRVPDGSMIPPTTPGARDVRVSESRPEQKLEHFESTPTECRSRRDVNQKVLLGKQATEANQKREEEDRGPEMGEEVQRRQHGHRTVHARETVRWSIETLHVGQESFRWAALRVLGAPSLWRGYGKQRENDG